MKLLHPRCVQNTFRLLAAACLFGSVPAPAQDWPEFLGPTRNNVSAEKGLRARLPAAGVPIVWKKDIGTGYSAPSILGNTLVIHHRIGNAEIVEACDVQSGKTLWKQSYPSRFQDPYGYNNGPRCSPLLTDEFCYTFGAEGVLLCLHLRDGSPVWRRDTNAEFNIPEAFFGVGSSPVLENGKLIVILGGQPNSGVVAFDAKTGKTLWENGGEKTWNGEPMHRWPGERLVAWNTADPAFQKQASYCTPVMATIHGKRHALCVTRQGLLSLDPETGARHFAYWFRARQDSSVNAMTPVVEKDCVLISSAYFRSGSILLRVQPDGKGVEEVWSGLQMEMHWSRPVLHQGHLYGFSGRNEPDAQLRCVRWSDGKVFWDRYEGWPNPGHSKLRPDEKPPEFFGRGSFILAGEKLVALGECGRLGLFEPTPEKVTELGTWQVPGLQYPCWAGPVLAQKRLFLRDESLLLCLDWAAAQP